MKCKKNKGWRKIEKTIDKLPNFIDSYYLFSCKKRWLSRFKASKPNDIKCFGKCFRDRWKKRRKELNNKMTNFTRWKWGETNCFLIEENPTFVVEIGYLVYLKNGKIFPIQSARIPILPKKSTAKAELAKKFIGVAMSSKNKFCRVATEGVFSFYSSNKELVFGDMMTFTTDKWGMYKNLTLVKTDNEEEAIAFVVKDKKEEDKEVYVKIISRALNINYNSNREEL